MSVFLKHSITLVELLVAVALLGLLILGISNLDTFARLHLVTSDRRMQVQNNASFVLEHMAKEIAKAIGNRAIPGEDPVDLADISSDRAIKVYVDLAPGGILPGDGLRGTGGDRVRAYRSRLNTGGPSTRYQFWYCSECGNPACSNCAAGWEVLDRGITSFNRNATDNHIYIEIIACWDPTEAVHNCGTLDNPRVTMRTQIKMNAVTVN
ncbi:MAG: hypothetical protein PVI33_04885 [Candidatus Omnitrophota bacterium]|jgi:hypothetical protein